MVRRSRVEGGHRGGALISALLALLMVSVALAIAAGGIFAQFHALRLESSTVELTALTDAAVADALAHLAEDEGFPGFTRYRLSEGEAGGGELESSVHRDGPGRFRVRGAAFRGHQGHCVEVRVARAEERLTVLGWIRRVDGSATDAAECVAETP